MNGNENLSPPVSAGSPTPNLKTIFSSGIVDRSMNFNFDLGNNKYFYVNDIFGKNANWSIIGSGKVTNKKIDNYEHSCRMVRVLSGSLQIDVKEFRPLNNIEFGIICENYYNRMRA